MNVALAQLALRRALSPATVLLSALSCALVAATASVSPEALRAAFPDPAEATRAASELARAGAWGLLLALFLSLAVLRAARTFASWREGEVDWIAGSARGPWSVLLSTWAGQALGTAALLGLAAVAAELAAGERFPSRVLVRRYETPRLVLMESGKPHTLELEPPFLGAPQGSVLRARLLLVAAAPYATVRLAAWRAGGAERSSVVKGIHSRAPIEIAWPAGEGPVVLELERVEDGAIVALEERGVDLLAPAGTGLRAGLSILARSAASAAAWIALALGLGAWLRPATAFLACLALAVPWWLGDLEGRARALGDWLPWTSLPQGVALAGEGVSLPPADPRLAAGTLALVLGGWLLARLRAGRWRMAP